MEKKETKRILKTIEYYYSDGKEHKRCPVCGIDPVKLEQELDKAREEVLTELQEEFSEFGVPDDVRYTKPLFYINEIIEEKLSKLKDNK